MGIESVLKIGEKALTQVAKKAYVKPMCEVKILKSLGLKMEQLTADVTQFSKKMVSSIYLPRINSIEVVGMKNEYKGVHDLINQAMLDISEKTKGIGRLPQKIAYEPLLKHGNDGVACVDREGILHINTNYLENIDKVIINDLNQFIKGGAIKRDCFGKYRLANYLVNSETLEFEEKLNNYLSKRPMSLKDKFVFHRKDMVNCANLTSQIHQTPNIMIEQVLSNSFNRESLIEKGLLKTAEEIKIMPLKEQIAYLKNILRYCTIPHNATLALKENSVFLHEIGHLNHYANLSIEEHSKLQKLAMYWQLPIAKSREVASRVSSYSMVSPLEFVADTYSGLVNGQSFHPDVIEWYTKLKGPIL